MGKLKQFSIQLERQDAVYFAGNLVNGQVIVHLSDKMKMRGIHVAFKGEARVYWTENEASGGSGSITRHYEGQETYFDQSVVLFGKPKGEKSGDNPVLPAGQYAYPFQFELLPNLPSSYEGGDGRVRYKLKATIEKPFKFDHTVKLPFTVVGVVDLNQMPDVRTPLYAQEEKMICCFCCASGPITASLKLDRYGYVPGEYITLHGEIDNQSTQAIGKSEISLVGITTFFATTNIKTENKIVCKIRRDGLKGGATDCFDGLSFLIPPLPPSNLPGCNIIDIEYLLKFTVYPSAAKKIELLLPITIGTIPLQNVQMSFTQDPFEVGLHDQNMWINTPPLFDGDPMLSPPPSYAMSVWGCEDMQDEDDNEHTVGPNQWAPAYPYYTWSRRQCPYPPDQQH